MHIPVHKRGIMVLSGHFHAKSDETVIVKATEVATTNLKGRREEAWLCDASLPGQQQPQPTDQHIAATHDQRQAEGDGGGEAKPAQGEAPGWPPMRPVHRAAA